LQTFFNLFSRLKHNVLNIKKICEIKF
jgi:hypothetical protein